MSRRPKRPDPFESHEQRRLLREQESRLVGEEFSRTHKIQIELVFEDYDNQCHPKPGQMEYSIKSKSFFELKCPFHECVMGGFDLSAAVRQAISARLTHATGSTKCSGWQDRDRIGKHGCSLKANYEIRIQYESGS